MLDNPSRNPVKRYGKFVLYRVARTKLEDRIMKEKYTLAVHRDGGIFVVTCPEHNVSASGHTALAALKNVESALSRHLAAENSALPRNPEFVITADGKI